MKGVEGSNGWVFGGNQMRSSEGVDGRWRSPAEVDPSASTV